MANACRDNFERAQFVGYDPRMVRFFQFALSGFFAGIAGGLYALTYEIVTFDTVAGGMSANALLMTYIGGVGTFAGPIVGAILIVLLQSWVSLLSNSWLVYVGVLFILMVTFAPGGIAGLVLMHQPIARGGRLGPARRALCADGGARPLRGGGIRPADRAVLLPHHRRASQGKTFMLAGATIDPKSPVPWAIGALLLGGGGLWLWREGRRVRAAWDAVMEEIKAAAARA